VDAAEIDPAIYGIGRAENPNRPYQDPRVTIHIDDGRSFVRKTSAPLRGSLPVNLARTTNRRSVSSWPVHPGRFTVYKLACGR
jgi:hypothetical protein